MSDWENSVRNQWKNHMENYNMRITEIINYSEDYLSDFYEESPNYWWDKDYVNKLIWLTYSDKEKKDILDKDLDEYFS